MTTAVSFRRVTRRFGHVRAVDEVDFDIAEGEFFAMLGPSGSGKTTCLRLIAGFDLPDAGEIAIFGASMKGVPPYRRQVNTVFQDYALFPHLSVIDNVAYGLRVAGIARRARTDKAEKALDLVGLQGFDGRRPAQLSGGQRQRVALARALVMEPRVLLLDEPLGALDLKLREAMQDELKALQRRLGITFVFVTHDQGEALSMADRVAVFNRGQIQQVGSPEEIYQRPRTSFVADFVGSSNILPPDYCVGFGGPAVWCSLRPEAVRLTAPDGAAMRGKVSSLRYLGGASRVTVTTPRSALRRAGRTADRDGAAGGGAGAGAARGCRRSARRSALPATPPRCIRWSARWPGCPMCCWRRPRLFTLLLLAGPVLWLGIIYLGSLVALLAQSFFSIDEFSGMIDRTPTLKSYRELLRLANLDIILRTAGMAALVTLASVVVAFPIAFYAARYARGRLKALFYLAAMLPLWSSYLVKVYSWKLILAKEGILAWGFDKLGLTGFSRPGWRCRWSAAHRFRRRRPGPSWSSSMSGCPT